jgi:hypothetical protein
MAFQPDAVIANGDHVYQDQRTWLESNNPAIRKAAIEFYKAHSDAMRGGSSLSGRRFDCVQFGVSSRKCL